MEVLQEFWLIVMSLTSPRLLGEEGSVLAVCDSWLAAPMTNSDVIAVIVRSLLDIGQDSYI